MMRSTSCALAWLARWLCGLILLLALLRAAFPGPARAPACCGTATIHDAWPVGGVLADPRAPCSDRTPRPRPGRFRAPRKPRGTWACRRNRCSAHPGRSRAHFRTACGCWTSTTRCSTASRFTWPPPARLRQPAPRWAACRPEPQRPLRSRARTRPLTMLPGRHYDLLLRVETRGAMVLPSR